MKKFLREWFVVTLIVLTIAVCVGLTYRVGAQSATRARNQATVEQQDKIELVTKIQAVQQANLNSKQAEIDHVLLQNAALCQQNVNTWNTFQRVIQAATNPPSQAGRTLTPEQLLALKAYRESLLGSVGEKPVCN